MKRTNANILLGIGIALINGLAVFYVLGILHQWPSVQPENITTFSATLAMLLVMAGNLLFGGLLVAVNVRSLEVARR